MSMPPERVAGRLISLARLDPLCALYVMQLIEPAWLLRVMSYDREHVLYRLWLDRDWL